MFDLGSIFVSIKVKTNELDQAITSTKTKLGSFGDAMSGAATKLAAVGAVAGAGLFAMSQGMNQALKDAADLQGAMIGLSNVATRLGFSATVAKEAAASLAADGLVSVSTAAGGLQKLLQAGVGLDTAITLMKGYKDQAAFGRSSTISFDQAVGNLAESFYTQNSAIGNLSGQTENWELILEKGAKTLGKKVSELTEEEKILAKVNGQMLLNNIVNGDAAEYAKTFGGEQAKLNAQQKILSATIGTALQPAMLKLFEVVTPLIVKLADWIEQHPKLFTGIVIFIGVLLGLVAVVGLVAGVIAGLVALFSGSVVIAIIAAIAAIAALAAAAYGVLTNWTLVKTFFTELWATIKTGWSNFVASVMTTLESWKQAVILTFTSMIDAVKRAFQSFVDWLVAAFLSIPYWYGYAWGLMIRIAMDMPFVVANLVVSAFNWMIDSAKNNFNSFINFVTWAWNTIKNGAIDLYNSLTHWFNQLPGRLAAAGISLGIEAGRIGWNIHNSIKDGLNALPGLISNAIGQMISTITGSWGRFYDSAKKLASNIWKGFKDGLDMHSPSNIERAMTNIVKNTKESIGELTGNLHGLATSLDGSVVSGAVGGVAGGMVINLPNATISNQADAEAHAEVIGDAIITKLQRSRRI